MIPMRFSNGQVQVCIPASSRERAAVFPERRAPLAAAGPRAAGDFSTACRFPSFREAAET